MRAMILALTMAAGAASAGELERMEVEGSAAEGADRLVAAVEEAGASVVARVDHAAGAESVDMDLPPAIKVVFGNPTLGTPVMQAEPLAGYVLPLQMLVYEDAEGQAWIAVASAAGRPWPIWGSRATPRRWARWTARCAASPRPPRGG